MTREELILAALAASGGGTHTPVQIQKLLFLIDKKLAAQVGGPHFDFVPYDYGPFDSSIYTCLDRLAARDLVEVISEPNLRWKKYRLRQEGLQRGANVLSSLHPSVQAYLRDLAGFVRRLSFAQLVASIYRAYPEMKVNSVFRG
jgi:hypothetical protein